MKHRLSSNDCYVFSEFPCFLQTIRVYFPINHEWDNFSSLSAFYVPSPFTFWLMIRHVCGQVSLGRDCSSLMCSTSCWGVLWLGLASRLEFLASLWETLLFSLSLSLFDKLFPSFVSNFSSLSSDMVLTVSPECWLLCFETSFQVVKPGNLTSRRCPRLGVVHADIRLFRKDSFGGILRINRRRIKYQTITMLVGGA